MIERGKKRVNTRLKKKKKKKRNEIFFADIDL